MGWELDVPAGWDGYVFGFFQGGRGKNPPLFFGA
jgi:hypothetical protein